MMDTVDHLAHQLPTTSMTTVQAKQLALLDQPTVVQIRELVALCQQMSQQYRESPEVCMTHSWWLMFNQAGILLHEALDQAKAEGYRGLSNEEAERAYFLVIHVAYFFIPGGVAGTVWPMLPAEPGVKEEGREQPRQLVTRGPGDGAHTGS